MTAPYSVFVNHVADAKPRLRSLDEFLQDERARKQNSSIAKCVKYMRDGTAHLLDANSKSLSGKIESFMEDDQSGSLGMCVLVEDVNSNDINILGSLLDIDPDFFCGHLNTKYESIENRPPTCLMSSLPSLIASQQFVHLHYQRVLEMGDMARSLKIAAKFCLLGNSSRLVKRMPSLSGKYMGLARACFSVFYKKLPNDRWIGVMLMDPTLIDLVGCFQEEMGSRHNNFTLHQRSVRPHIDNLKIPSSYSTFKAKGVCKTPEPLLLIDELSMALLHLVDTPNSVPSSLLSLSKLPLKTVLSEWMLYSFLISRYVKIYEYPPERIKEKVADIENEDILDLYKWRRRSQQSLHKLQIIKWFITQRSKLELDSSSYDLLVEDIEYVASQIEQSGRSLEAMVPVVTSMIQLMDARRSMEVAVYVKRLSYIAIVFLPLSYPAALFSMSPNFEISGPLFWIYPLAAISLLVLVLLILNSPFDIKDVSAKSKSIWTKRHHSTTHVNNTV